MGREIDFRDNTLHLRISGGTVLMEDTSSGHLVIDLAKNIKKEEAIK